MNKTDNPLLEGTALSRAWLDASTYADVAPEIHEPKYAWYLHPETGDTKVFDTVEEDLIRKAGYRLVGLGDLPLLSLHALGLLVKTPPDLLAKLRDGSITLGDLDYNEERGVMVMREGEGRVQTLSELGRLL